MILVRSLKDCGQNIQLTSHFGYFNFWETLWEVLFSESARFENQATEEFLCFYMGNVAKCGQGQAQYTPTQTVTLVKFVLDRAITHLLFWKVSGHP